MAIGDIMIIMFMILLKMIITLDHNRGRKGCAAYG